MLICGKAGADVATPHSDWPYVTQDPNKPETEKAGEASLAFARYVNDGATIEEIAEQLGISRATAYRRIKQHSEIHDQPPRALRQLRAEGEIERLTRATRDLLDGEASIADKTNLIKELRMLNLSWRKLYAVDEIPVAGVPTAPPVDPEVAEWVAAARAESEIELRRVRGG